ASLAAFPPEPERGHPLPAALPAHPVRSAALYRVPKRQAWCNAAHYGRGEGRWGCTGKAARPDGESPVARARGVWVCSSTTHRAVGQPVQAVSRTVLSGVSSTSDTSLSGRSYPGYSHKTPGQPCRTTRQRLPRGGSRRGEPLCPLNV